TPFSPSLPIRRWRQVNGSRSRRITSSPIRPKCLASERRDFDRRLRRRLVRDAASSYAGLWFPFSFSFLLSRSNIHSQTPWRQMTNQEWIDMLKVIPEEDQNTLVVVLQNGAEVNIDTFIRFESNYVIIRGRVGGTTDEGRAFFIPYDQMLYFRI